MRKIFYMLHSILLGLFLLSNIVTAETLVYYHNDQIGNPIIATDQAGNKLWEVEYTPYGEPTSDVSELDNENWFGAKPYDEDTKLSHQGDRHYQVQIGRFLSIDPLDFNSDNILTFNRYAYGNNNPYKYNDPTGNAAETPWDVLNVTISAASFSANITSGNFLGAAIDAVGIGYDLIATAIPGLPAGGGTGIKAARAADTALEASQGGKQVGKSVVNAGGAQSKTAKGGGNNRGGGSNGGGSNGSSDSNPKFTSNAARRQTMREQGIPTSQQPASQSKNASGYEYSYEVPASGGGTQIKSVQQQTLDRSHPGQGHWEAGSVKTNSNTGRARMNRYGRPPLRNTKSKVNYDK